MGIDARMVRITGIGRYTEELVCGLERVGVLPTVFVSPVDAAWWHLRHPHVPYRIAPEAIYSWSEQLLLPARFARERFEVVHFTNFNVPLAFRGPFVVTIHDTIPLHYAGERRRSGLSQQAYRKVLRSALERAERVIVPSVQVRDELAVLGDIAHVAVVPHAVSDAFCGPTVQPAEAGAVFNRLSLTEPYLLYVGNYRSHKNVDTLVRAFAEVRRSLPRAVLVLAGPITVAQRSVLVGLARQLQVLPGLRIVGAVSDAELRVLYDGARLVVVPSFIEGFGLPALEAAARGTLVVASNTTPVREFLQDGVLTVDPRDIEQLASTIVIAWSTPALRTRLTARARSLALQRDWQTVAQETLAVYERAVAGRPL
ncbi:MAG: glycosyltransferase family 1 protein [Candidatus Andersenbacteria bacterium]